MRDGEMEMMTYRLNEKEEIKRGRRTSLIEYVLAVSRPTPTHHDACVKCGYVPSIFDKRGLDRRTKHADAIDGVPSAAGDDL